MGIVYYGVIALTRSQAEEIIEHYESENPDLANWLKENKDDIYGNDPIEWKPFNNVSIKELIENDLEDLPRKETEHRYKSQTELIVDIDEKCDDVDDISGIFDIDVFFIDIFSIYVEKYKHIAQNCDSLFSENHNCCFLMNYSLPRDLRIEIEKEYSKVWKFVNRKYIRGDLHRVVFRVDDLNNFKNYLINIDKIMPTKKALRKMKEYLKQPQVDLITY